MGAKRLAPFLPELVESLERHGHLTVTPEVKAALVQLKPTTIDRKLRPHHRQRSRRPFGGGNASASAIKAQVPLRTFTEWSGVEPGSIQIDLVLHCGDTTAGFYVTTLTAVDVASSWTERVAIWGKTQQAVAGGLHRVRTALPIPVREVHSDNGSEFLNDLLQPYCQKAGIRTTRGRPYKKNDQAYVEQKNWTAVRAVVGYARYSSRPAFTRLGELYELERLYRNFFQPVRKLVAKEREGAKVRKRYDMAQTPYQRLVTSGKLDAPRREQLARLHDLLDPVHLQQQIADAQRALFAERELPKTSRAARLHAGQHDGSASDTEVTSS
jgi:transposase InsO family protein